MIAILQQLFAELLSSKKFTAMLLGLVAPWIASKLDVPPEQVLEALLPLGILIGAYMIGQGKADEGKEAAKLNLEAAREARVVSDPLPADRAAA